MGGWVGPYLMGFVKTETGTFDLGYFIMAFFLVVAGVTILSIKYGWNGKKNRQHTETATVAFEKNIK